MFVIGRELYPGEIIIGRGLYLGELMIGSNSLFFGRWANNWRGL